MSCFAVMLLFHIMGSVIETIRGVTGQHDGRGAERCVCAHHATPRFLITNSDLKRVCTLWGGRSQSRGRTSTHPGRLSVRKFMKKEAEEDA